MKTITIRSETMFNTFVRLVVAAGISMAGYIIYNDIILKIIK